MWARMMVFAGFLVAFSAGLMIGLRAPRQAEEAAPSTRPSGRGGFLARELNLTPQQQEQMKQIWSETARRGHEEYEQRRRQYRRERDEAIAALIPPSEMAAYDQILDTYARQMSQMEEEARQAYQAAVERTRQILTPQQRVRYEEFLKRHQWGGGSYERTSVRRAEDRATSRPASEP